MYIGFYYAFIFGAGENIHSVHIIHLFLISMYILYANVKQRQELLSRVPCPCGHSGPWFPALVGTVGRGPLLFGCDYWFLFLLAA